MHLYQPKLKNGERSSVFWVKQYVGRVNGKDQYRRHSTGESDLEKAKKALAVAEHKDKAGEVVVARPEKLRYEDIRANVLTYYTNNESRDAKEVGRRLAHLDPSSRAAAPSRSTSR